MSVCLSSCVPPLWTKRLRQKWNCSRREGEKGHRPHGRCDEKRKLVRITTAPAWRGSRKNLHRKGDLAAIPTVIRPPPKAARIALPLREDKYRMMEAFPSDAAMAFRKRGKSRKQLILPLQNATKTASTPERGAPKRTRSYTSPHSRAQVCRRRRERALDRMTCRAFGWLDDAPGCCFCPCRRTRGASWGGGGGLR